VQESNKYVSANVTRQTFGISCITAAQAFVWILYGVYVGQIKLNWTTVAGDSWDSTYYVPSLLLSAAKVWLMLFLADFSSYGYHRLGHEWRWLYTNVHALHHEHKNPHHSFYALQYGTALDMILSNVCFFCGILWIPNDLYICTLYGFISTLYVSAGHSGLLLPGWLDFWFDSSYHSLHHQRYGCNFAEHFTIVDRLLGTYSALKDEDKNKMRTLQLKTKD
jgi:lathosterol oxidase